MMKARDVMTTSVQTLPAGTLVTMAAEFLRDNGFSAAPFIDEDGNMVGVVTRSALAAPTGRQPVRLAGRLRSGIPLPSPFGR